MGKGADDFRLAVTPQDVAFQIGGVELDIAAEGVVPEKTAIGNNRRDANCGLGEVGV
jgi:hypothetical protein